MTVQYDAACAAMMLVTDPEELNKLSNNARHVAAQRARRAFRVGDDVEFTGKYGSVEHGKVIGIGPKNFKVKVGHMTWTVGPTLLRPSSLKAAPAVVPPIPLKTSPIATPAGRYESAF